MVRDFFNATNLFWTLVFLLCLSFLPLHWIGWPPNPLNAIHGANDQYLTTAITNNKDDITTTVRSLAVVGVLSSTEIGIDLVVHLDVEVGDELSTMQDALERVLFWGAAASAVLEGWKISLGVVVWITPVMYKLAILAVLLFLLAHGYQLGRKARQLSTDVLRVVLFAALFTCVILPVSFYATGLLTSALDLHQLLEKHPAVAALHDQAQAFGAPQDLTSFWGDASKVKDGLNSFHSDALSKTLGLMEYTTGLIVFHLMQGVVFPLAAGFLAWSIGVALFRYLVEPIED